MERIKIPPRNRKNQGDLIVDNGQLAILNFHVTGWDPR